MPNSSSCHGRDGHDQVNARFPRFATGVPPVARKVPFSGEARRGADPLCCCLRESSRLLAFVVRFFWLRLCCAVNSVSTKPRTSRILSLIPRATSLVLIFFKN